MVFCDDDAGEFLHCCRLREKAKFFLRLSRLRGRPDCIARCDPGGGSLLSGTRGETPTPTLPRKREREPYDFPCVALRDLVMRISLRGDVLRELALDAVDGQAWQPQAEDTPTVH